MYWIKKIGAFALILVSFSGCLLPQKGSTSKKDATPTSTSSNSLGLSIIKVGSTYSSSPETDLSGNLYTKYNDVRVYGSCTGTVTKIKVSYTPLAGTTTNETISCIGSTFDWTGTLTTQTIYSFTFSPMNSSSTVLTDVASIIKSITYDATNPVAPTFITPSSTNTYDITNGATNITITGQVLSEVTKLMGPDGIALSLVSNPDLVHKDFSYNATIPDGTSVAFTFTAYDTASNISSSTMTINSILSVSIPVAAQEIGGSHVNSGLVIESTAGYMSDIVVNNNVKHVTGSAAILGSF